MRWPPGCWRSASNRATASAIWAPNCAEWVVTQFATAKAGLILVNINPAYRLAELEYALNKVGCRALVTATAFKTSDYVGDAATRWRRSWPRRRPASCAPQAAEAAHRDPDRRRARARRARASTMSPASAAPPSARRLAELAPQRCSSTTRSTSSSPRGTTGAPKGATLTHHNILNNGFFIGEAMRFTEQDRLCIPVPLYHCFGMVIGNLACITHGAAMVFPGEGFDPLATLQTVADGALHRAATACRRCSSPSWTIPDFARFDLSSLRTGIMAGSPCPIEVMRRVRRRDAPARDHDRLRHDRNQPGQLPDRDRRPARAARRDRRPHPCRMSRSRSSMPRAASCRAARRANSAPAAIR